MILILLDYHLCLKISDNCIYSPSMVYIYITLLVYSVVYKSDNNFGTPKIDIVYLGVVRDSLPISGTKMHRFHLEMRSFSMTNFNTIVFS